MSLFTDIKEIQSTHVAITLATVAATLAVGALVIFEFQRPLFVSLDWFRFTILAFSIPLPSLLLNHFLWVVGFQDNPKIKLDPQQTMSVIHIFACMYSCMGYALGVLVSHLFGLKFTWFALIVLATHGVMIGITIALRKSANRAKRQIQHQ